MGLLRPFVFCCREFSTAALLAACITPLILGNPFFVSVAVADTTSNITWGKNAPRPHQRTLSTTCTASTPGTSQFSAAGL